MKKAVAFTYLVKNTKDNTYKIGYTRSNPSTRLKAIQTGSSGLLELISYNRTEHGQLIERTLHNRFQCDNTNGEWFELPISIEVEFETLCTQLESNFKMLADCGNKFI